MSKIETFFFLKLNQLAIAKGYYYAQTRLKQLTNSVNWQIKLYQLLYSENTKPCGKRTGSIIVTSLIKAKLNFINSPKPDSSLQLYITLNSSSTFQSPNTSIFIYQLSSICLQTCFLILKYNSKIFLQVYNSIISHIHLQCLSLLCIIAFIKSICSTFHE